MLTLNKNFSLLLSGQTLANIGDVLYMVSIISVIFVLTGSATAASFVPFTITSAMFVSSLLTPLLIGKVNLKWLLALGTGFFGVGSLLMGMLADLFGVRTVFMLSALLLAIVSIIVYRNKRLFIKRAID